MKTVDLQLSIAYYNAARPEIVQRIVLRDRALLTSLATAGVIAGLGIQRSQVGTLGVNPWLLGLLPFSATAFSMFLWRHNRVIRLLDQYICEELTPILNRLREPEQGPSSAVPAIPHWNVSPLFQRTRNHRLWLEALPDLLFLWVPATAAVIFTIPDWHSAPRGEVMLFALGLLAVCTRFFLLVFRFVKLSLRHKGSSVRPQH